MSTFIGRRPRFGGALLGLDLGVSPHLGESPHGCLGISAIYLGLFVPCFLPFSGGPGVAAFCLHPCPAAPGPVLAGGLAFPWGPPLGGPPFSLLFLGCRWVALPRACRLKGGGACERPPSLALRFSALCAPPFARASRRCAVVRTSPLRVMARGCRPCAALPWGFAAGLRALRPPRPACCASRCPFCGSRF